MYKETEKGRNNQWPFHTEKRVFSCQSVKTSELVTEFIYLEYPTGVIVTILNKAKSPQTGGKILIFNKSTKNGNIIMPESNWINLASLLLFRTKEMHLKFVIHK